MTLCTGHILALKPAASHSVYFDTEACILESGYFVFTEQTQYCFGGT